MLLMGCFNNSAGADTLTLNNFSASNSDSPGPVSASIRLTTDGYLQRDIGAGYLNVNAGVEWIDNNTAGVGSDYEVQLTKTTGTTPTGPTLATYHALSSTRTWTITRVPTGTTSFTGTLTVREIADTSNTVSCTVTISAQVF